MASSGSSSSVPWEVVDDLVGVGKLAEMLQGMFNDNDSPTAERVLVLVDGMMTRVTSALSVLNTSVGGSSGGGGRRNRAGGPHRRSSSSSTRRRTLSPLLETVTTDKEEDGHAWRKYGQKFIQDSMNPRSYYRCTHMPDQGCKARKHVQVSDTNPSEFIVSYFDRHTCRDPSTVPIVIEAAADAPTNLVNFISFAGYSSSLPQQAATPATMVLSHFAGYSTSLPAAHQERCGGSEEAISSISPDGQLGAVVGSSPTGRSAPEYDMLFDGIDTPSSLSGFITGSFGSFVGDDDLFGFDT